MLCSVLLMSLPPGSFPEILTKTENCVEYLSRAHTPQILSLNYHSTQLNSINIFIFINPPIKVVSPNASY